jgi:hypothetical protein
MSTYENPLITKDFLQNNCRTLWGAARVQNGMYEAATMKLTIANFLQLKYSRINPMTMNASMMPS